MLLAFKIGVILAALSLLTWVGVYSWLQPWWRHRIGRTLVIFAGIIVAQDAIFIMSLFVSLSAAGKHVAGWVYTGFVFLTAGVGVHRSFLWIDESRRAHAERLRG